MYKEIAKDVYKRQLNIRIIIQFTADISKHCFVRISADTAI